MKKRNRPSAAMIVAVVAMVLALGGTATAARILITSPSQIKNRVITGKKLKKRSITADLLARGVLVQGRAGERGAAGPKGDPGPAGPKGDPGVAGPRGPSETTMFTRDTGVTVTGTESDVATLIAETPELPPGAYLLQAKLVAQSTGDSDQILAFCELRARTRNDVSFVTLGDGGGSVMLAPLSLQVAERSDVPVVARIGCWGDAPYAVSSVTLTATRVDTAAHATF